MGWVIARIVVIVLASAISLELIGPRDYEEAWHRRDTVFAGAVLALCANLAHYTWRLWRELRD